MLNNLTEHTGKTYINGIKGDIMLSCSTCREVKDESEFSKNKAVKNRGYAWSCKKCYKSKFSGAYKKEKRQGYKYWLTDTYAGRKLTQNKYFGELPFTKEELHEWVQAQPNFKALWDKRMQTGAKEDAVSIDRLDNRYGYSFDNMRLVSWAENDEAGHICQALSDKVKANNTSGHKGVNKSRNSWEASIVYKGERFRKVFTKLEDAIAYRKELEQMIRERIDVN